MGHLVSRAKGSRLERRGRRFMAPPRSDRRGRLVVWGATAGTVLTILLVLGVVSRNHVVARKGGRQAVAERANGPTTGLAPIAKAGEAPLPSDKGTPTSGASQDAPMKSDGSSEEVGDRLSDSIVRIETFEADDTPIAVGTGFIVDVGGVSMVLTNRHVIEGATKISARFLINGNALGMELAYASDDADLAVLRTYVKGRMPAWARPLVLNPELESVADREVAALGFPGGVEGLRIESGRTDGCVASGDSRYVVISADIGHGNSGGPVIDTKTGAVIGMTTIKIGGKAQGLAIPASVIQRELRAAAEAVGRKNSGSSRSRRPSTAGSSRDR